MSVEQKLIERSLRDSEMAARRLGVAVAGFDDEESQERLPDEPSETGPVRVWISYENAQEEVSSRTVLIREIWRTSGTIYFRGFCELKRGSRTFRADQVEALICAATGEVADDPAAWLAAHGLFGGDRERDFTPHALRLCRHELAVMAYLARADGVLDPDEVEVMVDFVMVSTDRDIDRDRAAEYIRRLTPDYTSLPENIARLAASPKDRWPALARAIRRLVDADRELPVREQLAWLEIETAFKDERRRSLMDRIEREHRRGLEIFGPDFRWMEDYLLSEMSSRLEVEPALLADLISAHLNADTSPRGSP